MTIRQIKLVVSEKNRSVSTYLGCLCSRDSWAANVAYILKPRNTFSHRLQASEKFKSFFDENFNQI